MNIGTSQGTISATSGGRIFWIDSHFSTVYEADDHGNVITSAPFSANAADLAAVAPDDCYFYTVNVRPNTNGIDADLLLDHFHQGHTDTISRWLVKTQDIYGSSAF